MNIHYCLTTRSGRLRNIACGVIAICATLAITPAMAEQSSHPQLIVKQHENVEVVFPISEHPVITNENTTVHVVSDSRTFSAEIADILGFNIKNSTPSGISDPETSVSDVEINGNTILVKGLADGMPVYVYSINGTVAVECRSASGIVSVDISKLPSGLYILSVNGVSYKIKK